MNKSQQGLNPGLPDGLYFSDTDRPHPESNRILGFEMLYSAEQKMPEDIFNNEKLLYDISRILHGIGVPVHRKGYLYLREAILTAIEKSTVNVTTMSIYHKIAAKYQTTADCVQRAIRNAISAAWADGEFECKRYYFGNNAKARKPTNSQFIATIADRFVMNSPNLGV